MIHKNRGNRRWVRRKKITERMKMLKGNERKGVVYERQLAKLQENGGGYMAKHGNLMHYAQKQTGGYEKTRDRNSHTGTNNWKARDRKKLDSMQDAEKEA